MEAKALSKNIILKYGFLLGLISILPLVITYTQNKHLEQSQAIGLISVLFILIAVILGIRSFSKKHPLSFVEGLKIGIGITIISALMVTIYNHIFSTYIEPDFINQMAEVQKEAMKASGKLTPEDIKLRIDKLKEGADSLIPSAIGIVFSAFLGFVFSAITAVIFMKINESKIEK
jgi:hypothetical protein